MAYTYRHTLIPASIAGRTRSGRYWHKVRDLNGYGSLRTRCSNHQVTELLPTISLGSMDRCWKRGCA